ncbi:MAG: acyl carrier protein [Bacteroidales bacterium]|jgi:acyl carrier protein|nr:phosphopantetheine-binding protein [Bacteroidales bacterium]
MNRGEIEEKVRNFLTEELEIDEDKIFPESRLREDMGIDSLEIVDIVVLVEENFGFKLEAADFKTIKTLDEFCTVIENKLK